MEQENADELCIVKPSGFTIQSSSGIVNITATKICVASSESEIDLSDVLENIRILLEYIRKSPRNKK